MATSTLKWVLVGENKTGPAFKGAASGLDVLSTKAKSVGKNLSLYVTAPLAAVAAAGVKTAADFGVTMASLQVNSGASGKAMDSMREKAIQLGADTVFSAGDAADAMLELSKAGASTDDILGGMADAVVNLASAEEMDLATASGIVAKTMNQFGLSAEDAKNVVDTLAAGAVASTTSVQGLADGMTYVGSTAANLDVPLGSTTTALAALNNAGLDASVAGTSLNNFLLNLNPTSAKAKGAIKDLGLEFFNAKGELKPMPQIIGELNDKFDGMSKERQIGLLKTIFGKQGMRAATVLMQGGVDGWQELEDAATKSGVAQELADARMSGLAGSIEQMRGSMETAALTIGETLAPKVTALADKITGLVNWFTNLDDGTKNTVTNIGLVAAAIGPLTWGFGKAIDTAKSLKNGIDILHRGFSVAKGPVLEFGRTVATGAAGLVKATAAHVAHAAVVTGQTVKAMALATAAWVKNAASTVASTAALVAHKAISLVVAGASKALAAAQWLVNAAMSANPIGLVVAALVALGVGLKLAWDKSQTFRNVVVTVFATVGKAVLTMAEVWLRGYQWMTDKFLAFVQVVINGAAKAFGWVPGVGPKLKEAANGFEDFRRGVNDKFDAVIGKVGEWKTNLDKMPKRVKLEGEIRDLTTKLDEAKQRLKDPELSKQRKAELRGEIRDLTAKLATARRDLDSHNTGKTRTVKLDVDRRNQQTNTAAARRDLDSPATTRARTIALRGDISDVRSKTYQARSYIDGVHGKTVRIGVTLGLNNTTVRLPSGKVIPLAEGGIVTKPTLALIGEAGPEAVVPLGQDVSKYGVGGGGDMHVHFHSPIIGSQEDLARYITDAQLRFKRDRGGRELGIA